MTLPRYKVRILPEAEADIDKVHDYIAFERLHPVTANRYVHGIYKAISMLSLTGGMLSVTSNKYLRQRYGPGVRTAVYKKMTIIYTVTGDTVLVHRITAGSLII
jgi:plasmid stabilization system protein ParE